MLWNRNCGNGIEAEFWDSEEFITHKKLRKLNQKKKEKEKKSS